MTVPVLETRAVRKSYGAMVVVDGLDFVMAQGERRALIGPNGAGKTSFVNLISGRIATNSGTIHLLGADITRLAESARVARGIGRTFQINALFNSLSVFDNIAMAVAETTGSGWNLRRPRHRDSEVRDRTDDVLSRIGLSGDARQSVSNLPYGRQRLVEFGIALALRPKLLLLDEPAAGIPSGETGVILDQIAALPPDIAVLLIDHDMDVVFRFASRITVMAQGRILADGTPAEIAANESVREVYLGQRRHR